MKAIKRNTFVLLAVVTLLFVACNNSNTTRNERLSAKPEKELVFEKGDKIDSPNFTGAVWLNNLITADNENQNAVGSVTFSPGARTSWH